MTDNGTLPEELEEEDDEVPEALRDRWSRRDLQYNQQTHRHILTDNEIRAIRSWRLGEAEGAGDSELMFEAREWGGPLP